MDRETSRYLAEKEDLRVRAVAKLAIAMDVTFKEAEIIMDKLVEKSKEKIDLQKQFEAAMDAEFNIEGCALTKTEFMNEVVKTYFNSDCNTVHEAIGLTAKKLGISDIQLKEWFRRGYKWGKS